MTLARMQSPGLQSHRLSSPRCKLPHNCFGSGLKSGLGILGSGYGVFTFLSFFSFSIVLGFGFLLLGYVLNFYLGLGLWLGF